MDLPEAKEVVETIDSNEVNSYLKLGWVVIATASGSYEESEGLHAYIKYSLAWTKDGEPIKPQRSVRELSL